MTSCNENPFDTECTCLNSNGRIFDEPSQSYVCCDVYTGNPSDSRCSNSPTIRISDYSQLMTVFPSTSSTNSNAKILYFTNPNKGYFYAQRHVIVSSTRPSGLTIEYAIYSKDGLLEESSSNYRGHFRASYEYTSLERRNFQQSTNLTFIGLVLLLCVVIFLVILLIRSKAMFKTIMNMLSK